MTAEDFIRRWRQSTLSERSAAQSHFIELCALLGEEPPTVADPSGASYSFEKGAKKTGGGDGWADVWKKGCFAWEYKGKHKDLNAALRQLQQYALALDNPPLLIVSDMETIEIHTNFTNTVHTVHRLTLDDLANPAQRRLLKRAFTAPDELRPNQTRPELTEQAAAEFAALAQTLRERGHAPPVVAHFLNKLLFCLFAEDAGLLSERLFSRLLEHGLKQPARIEAALRNLFQAMAEGGLCGVEAVDWFNGGLFDGDEALPLHGEEIQALLRLARLDWSAIEPAIFGTLFERGLDPDKRSQLGAHYTDAASIRRLLEPLLVEPLLAEWAVVKADIAADRSKTRKKANAAYFRFLERLRDFRVLDPACGSGNFLYLALQALKDLEHRVMLEAEPLGLPRQFPAVGPECVKGIEINPYAAELARVTLWIGEIQWMLRHGFNLNRRPILRQLDSIEERDALLNLDHTEAVWPTADVIVGNPPFLGGSKLLRELGEDYVAALRRTFAGRVPGGADWVCYWFEKARGQIESDAAQRAGLIATNSIRGGANRKVLERILNTSALDRKLMIFNAWSDREWINEGAAVRVSLVCFGKYSGDSQLDGQPVADIYADLTGRALDASDLDLTQAKPLAENAGIAFRGTTKNGKFELSGVLARQWLLLPNPHGRPNSDVLYPWINGLDITRRYRDLWIIDFGVELSNDEAMLYEAPFGHVLLHVKPERDANRREAYREKWWIFGEARPGLRQAITQLSRYIVTPQTSKHRLFVWADRMMLPDQQLIAIAHNDDINFGILHSRFHELWALRLGSSLEDRPRYTPTTCFETFPFPSGLQPNLAPDDYANPHAAAIAEAAQRLNALRDNWLNPPQWMDRVPEIVPGYPDRIIPKPEYAAVLKQRTLTNLYNQRPAWLANAHRDLDQAVAAAYGWPMDLSDDEILRRLLDLNRARTHR